MADNGNDLSVLGWLVMRLWGCFVPKKAEAKPFFRSQKLRALSTVGADSAGIVAVICGCTGVILSLQSALVLERFGASSYVPNMVGLSMVKELGPLLTAIIVTGRSGAAFAAEVATMQITEEIDALEVMGLDPVRFIVWPKFLAMVVMMPCLTMLANISGIAAGGVFSALLLGLNGRTWLDNSVAFLYTADIWVGLLKSLGFAVTITLIGCWQGFLARRGAEDVGNRTTRAVVHSIFTIVLLDLFFTGLNYLFR